MRGSIAGLVTILVLVVLAIAALKLLGALISFAVKALLLAIVAGIAIAVYLAIQKQAGKPRD